MRVDLLDLVLLLLVIGFGVSGYRQGFIVGAMSFTGFLGGGVLGAFLSPSIVRSVVQMPAQQALLAILIVFLAAVIGQFAASTLGAYVRSHVTWHPAKIVDAVGGSLVSILSVLMIAWLLGTAVVRSPFPELRQQVRDSVVLRAVDEAMPEFVRSWFAAFRRIVDHSAFPQVFGGLGGEPVVPVTKPDESVLRSAELRRARTSIVKITGTAPACRRRIEGTGFVYARQRVMTNAHVVAGVRGSIDVAASGGRHYSGRVVLFDPGRDIAVLYVPGMPLRPLQFDGPAEAGDSAIVAGFPRDRGFTARPARVRARQLARGPDIYQDRQVTREIYSLRAVVQPGNSGGPLLAPDGDVYGVVFAAAVDARETGYALTAREVASDARAGRSRTDPVSTRSCD